MWVDRGDAMRGREVWVEVILGGKMMDRDVRSEDRGNARERWVDEVV